MRTIIILLFLFFFNTTIFSQTDYCQYIKLKFEETEVNGKRKLYVEPELKQADNDMFSSFVKRHQNRFDYILFNRIDSLSKYTKLYPDTSSIDSAFCKYLSDNQKINKYLNILSNNSRTPKLIFSKAEMMLIASRFFLCDKVNKTDTSISYHICIGINGQKELKSEKDFTVLEAFCFEALFDKINKENRPNFVQNFKEYIQSSSEKHKKDFVDFDLFLNKVKNDCYLLMEKDSFLATTLLQYYEENENNLGFQII